MNELRTARESELSRIKEIWQRCFAGEEIYTEHYFRHRFSPEHIAVLLQEGRIVSILTMIPVWLSAPGGSKEEGSMFYGIATDPAEQGKGYAGQLINYANQLLTERGSGFSVLVPAAEDLFGFYEKLGYRADFFLKEWVFSREEIVQMARKPISAAAAAKTVEAAGGVTAAVTAERETEEIQAFVINEDLYQETREAHCAGFPHLSYGLKEISYQQKTARLTGADLWGFVRNGRRGCAALEWIDEERLMVKELLVNKADLAAALLALSERYPAKEYHLRLPVSLGNTIPDGKVRPFGMIYGKLAAGEGLIEKKASTTDLPYLGLAFD